MSAAPAVFPTPGPAVRGTGPGPRPRHLRLVRPGEPVPELPLPDLSRPWGRPGEVPEESAPPLHPVAQQRARAGARRAGRLTRRGRLALTLGTTTVAVALVTALAVGLLGPAGAAQHPQTVVVQPGQTLSQVAAEELAELPLDRAVVEIQLANRLSTSQVAAGQKLVIPEP
ncbi:LysM peptidoglycan-binding domain-containing protein [Ornithinicoccus halotolerans]|uniref:LysM peptidoglycan-binding domain-containing protein n=1 Tax=Ornithinicoccus halotolerans TaxID=1748220 RepID=UPI0012975D2E|nr:LysM peptidoglycan-binding domain-containing protein [Ornithinicoccus halotolerans]